MSIKTDTVEASLDRMNRLVDPACVSVPEGVMMSNRTATVYTRVEPEVKERMETVLEEIGLSTSDAINLFCKEVVNYGGIPFELKARSAGSGQSSSEEGEITSVAGNGRSSSGVGEVASGNAAGETVAGASEDVTTASDGKEGGGITSDDEDEWEEIPGMGENMPERIDARGWSRERWIKEIQKGLDDVEKGNVYTIEEVFGELRRKYGYKL